MEADHSQLNNHFRPLVTTGLAFGATRWLTSIVRHSEWSEIVKATTTPLYADDGGTSTTLTSLNLSNGKTF